MTRAILLAAVLALPAGTALAQSSADQVAMIAAIAANGCRVTPANNAAILSAAGLSEDAARAVVQALLDSGRAAVEGGVLVLKTGGC
jgi:hypothetical protein